MKPIHSFLVTAFVFALAFLVAAPPAAAIAPVTPFANTGSMTNARYASTTTLLGNGKVLVAGGSYGGVLASAELYDVGLGFDSAAQPVILTATSPLVDGTSLVLTGTGFKGVSGASGGDFNDSPTNYPVVQLRSIENGLSVFLLSSNTSPWSDTSFTSVPVSGFPLGYALVTVFTNGIPSSTAIINVTEPLPPAGSVEVDGKGTIPAGSFKIKVQSKLGKPLKGKVTYTHNLKTIESTSITGVTLNNNGTHATITGVAKINGQQGFTFQADVDDLGKPGEGIDQFAITASDGTNDGGTLTGGEIKIKQ